MRMHFKVRKPFIYALVFILLLPSVSIGVFYLYDFYLDTAIGRYFKIQNQLEARAQFIKDPLLREVLLEDPAVVVKKQLSKGNLLPVGYQQAGGYSGLVGAIEAIGIDCPQEMELPIYYAESNTCLRHEVDFVIAERYSAYNRALVASKDYTGECRLKNK